MRKRTKDGSILERPSTPRPDVRPGALQGYQPNGPRLTDPPKSGSKITQPKVKINWPDYTLFQYENGVKWVREDQAAEVVQDLQRDLELAINVNRLWKEDNDRLNERIKELEKPISQQYSEQRRKND
jgi:hypothetical protein